MRFALAIALCSTAAFAWQSHAAPDGTPYRWRFDAPLRVLLVDPPAALRLRPGSDLRGAVVRAAEAWQAVATAHVPVRYAGHIRPRAAAEGEVTVQFDTDFASGHDTAGATELTGQGHDLVAAQIHLNAADFDWATDGSDTALDVQSLVEHELGHALGLGHPCGDPDTQAPSCAVLPEVMYQALAQDVMFPSIAAGPRRALTQDDVEGVTALQPAAASEPAPLLHAVVPGCVGAGDGQLRLVASGAAGESVEWLVADQVEFAEGIADGHVAAHPPLGRYDARIVAHSGKATVLFNALTVSANCKPGCSSSGGGLFAFAPLMFFAFRRRRFRLRFCRTAGFGAAVLALLCASPAFAYKRSVNAGGVTMWWSSRGHPFQIDAQGTPDVPGAAAFTAIRRSFLTWASIGCSDLSFEDQGLSQNPKDRVVGYFPGQYNRNLVLFRTRSCKAVVPPGDPCLSQGGCANAYDCWDHGDGVIATTTTTSNRFTGQIDDSDIEVNDAPGSDGTRFTFTAVDGPPCSDPNQTGCVRLDVQNTITHEAGHTLGLDHTPDPNATMYATAPEGETSKRVLGTDDIQGICDIYPRGAETVTGYDDPVKLSLAQGGGCGCSHTQTGPGAALGALILLLALRRNNGDTLRRRS